MKYYSARSSIPLASIGAEGGKGDAVSEVSVGQPLALCPHRRRHAGVDGTWWRMKE